MEDPVQATDEPMDINALLLGPDEGIREKRQLVEDGR